MEIREHLFRPTFSGLNKYPDMVYLQAFLTLPPPPATPTHKGSSFAIQLVLNTAIFCAEMTPDCKTGEESKKSP